MTAPGTPAETVSHYRLLELLGRGAMGEVWLAEDTQLPRKVAVKLLPRHLAQDRDAVERLLREAQAVASVDHPAVVTVYEAGLADGRPYLVMQRAEGETLEERLERGPLPVAEAAALATQIADALAEVHALGIVHRDLKPSNIVLTARGPKLLDFGVASLKGSPQLTATGAAVGTLGVRPAGRRCSLAFAAGWIVLGGIEPLALHYRFGWPVVVSALYPFLLLAVFSRPSWKAAFAPERAAAPAGGS